LIVAQKLEQYNASRSIFLIISGNSVFFCTKKRLPLRNEKYGSHLSEKTGTPKRS
jgi:hypothetical protein